jgi:Icc protein
MLNSAVPRKNHGHLGEEELAYLNRALEKSPKHAIVSLHHNPLPVGSAWLDKMVLDNAAAFWAVVDRYPHVRAVLFGHIHQEYIGSRGKVQLLATPSTCIQFLPKSGPFRLDAATPGFRRLRLHSDGKIETSLERLPSYPGPVEFESAGY